MVFPFDPSSLSTYAAVFLGLSLFAVCAFEFVNGFHDTANAVATVIYTKSMKPQAAVLWSGFMNFCGVWAGGIGVAMGIVKLLPLTEMMEYPPSETMAVVLALLIAAISWNLGTWYFGIPSSSSHTLIGAILGVGLGFQVIHHGAGVNWDKAKEIGLSLLLSPAFGFTMAIFLIFFMRRVFKKKELFKHPEIDSPPPTGIRAILIGTCTLVSFFHGSNDGQKGVGLLMVIMMTFLPVQFALNSEFGSAKSVESLERLEYILQSNAKNNILEKEFYKSIETVHALQTDIAQHKNTEGIAVFQIRKRVQTLIKSLELITKDPEILTNSKVRQALKSELKTLKNYTEFAPTWVILLISLSLGLGTMIGWKRIVVTIGEKIGKTHLTYGQGAASEIIAACTIGLSTGFGLPVSTTHVLSSGIAGSMVAMGGVKNLQKSTMTNILLAWVLTLPVTIILAFGLYLLFRLIL